MKTLFCCIIALVTFLPVSRAEQPPQLPFVAFWSVNPKDGRLYLVGTFLRDINGVSVSCHNDATQERHQALSGGSFRMGNRLAVGDPRKPWTWMPGEYAIIGAPGYQSQFWRIPHTNTKEWQPFLQMAQHCGYSMNSGQLTELSQNNKALAVFFESLQAERQRALAANQQSQASLPDVNSSTSDFMSSINAMESQIMQSTSQNHGSYGESSIGGFMSGVDQSIEAVKQMSPEELREHSRRMDMLSNAAGAKSRQYGFQSKANDLNIDQGQRESEHINNSFYFEGE